MPDDRGAVEAIEKLTGHPIPPMNVEGLDPVDWSEDDGRRRRGRGRASRPKAPAREKSLAREKLLTREKPPPRQRAAKPPPDKPRAPPTRETKRREPPLRDEDLGQRVKGFGDEMPAFMLLRARTTAKKGESEA
jgi:hypothetical protein